VALDFDEIYVELQPKIHNYLTRLLGNQDVEDSVQEVFTKVSNSLVNFKGQSKISTWVYRIATNTAIDKLRSTASKLKSGQAPLEDNSGMQATASTITQSAPPTDQKIIRKEMSECVREYVAGLPPDYRTVLILKELEGFKNREIAEILQITLENVKVRLHRARARLKQELDNGCEFYQNDDGTLACDRKPILIESRKSE